MAAIETTDEDILFTNVSIIDGSGTTPRYTSNVLVRHGLIAAVSPSLIPGPNTRTIDGDHGRWTLTPGFIDMHAHSDLSLLHTPAHLAKTTQGVTTEVIGQDGLSYSPVTDSTLARIRAQIAGWNGNPSDPRFWTWRSVREYLDALDGARIATNAAYLVPQGNLRALVKGWSPEPATPAEIEAMCGLLATAFEEGGAVGLSSGLTYVPGMFAGEAELARLCEVVVRFGGYYCPHHRSYGRGAMEAYREMIALARRTGVRLHLTHATLNFPENANRADELLAVIDEAIAEGVKISLDSYPYLPGATTLAATLPSWAAAADDRQALLADPASLAKIRRAALEDGTDGCHGVTLDFETIEISGVGDAASGLSKEAYVGKTLQQIALDQRRDPFDVYIDLLRADDGGRTTILQHVGHEANVRRIMRHAVHTAGSDGILTATKPHPRGWGTFPRYLGHYARDLARGRVRDIHRGAEEEGEEGTEEEETEPEEIFAGGLEEAVAHLTSRPARILRVLDRGLVKEGYRADLVLFDAEAIRDMATYASPQRPARGIRTVLVNGRFAVDEGRPTEERHGRTIRLRGDGHGGYVVR